MRISFLGGGSDLPSFYEGEVGAVLSTAVTKYVRLLVNRLSDLHDHRYRISYSKTELVNHPDEIQHPIVREALRMVPIADPLEIHSIADIPAGTGFGSSSAFTVGLLNALHAYRGELVSGEQLAEEASTIEIERLQEPIGKQDHYVAALGNLRFTEFYPDGTVRSDPLVVPLNVREQLFERLRLYYTGITRSAGSVLADQKVNTESGHARDLLRQMVKLARDAVEVLQDLEQLSSFGKLLHQGWELKRRLADGISSSIIDAHYETGLRAGAVGGKLLGAGGGGFFLFYVDPENRARLDESLSGLQPVEFALEPRGSRVTILGAA